MNKKEYILNNFGEPVCMLDQIGACDPTSMMFSLLIVLAVIFGIVKGMQ